jgi:hypothetical protein
MTTSQDRQHLLDYALAYAEAGWPVFPLRPRSKRPAAPNHTAETCDGSDRRCTDGHTGWEPRATLDADRITQAWRHRPYGIGIACGPAGLLVVDLDTAKTPGAPTGSDSLAELEHQTSETLPATWTVATPSGGRHLYYRQPADHPLGNTAGKLGPGIDTRGHGGYVVAPPTTTPAGHYWIVDDHPPADLPSWLAKLLTPRGRPAPTQDPRPCRPTCSGRRASRYAASALTGELDRIATAPEGRRNHTLFCAAIALGQLAASGLINADEVRQLLLDAAGPHITAGAYTHHQAQQTINSGIRRGLNEPRQIPTLTTTGPEQ